MHGVESVFLTLGEMHELNVQTTHVLVSHTCEWDRGRKNPNSAVS